MGSFKWYGDEFYAHMKGEAAKRLTKAAIDLTNVVKQNLSTKCPAWNDPQAAHSDPGDLPYLETGELRRSIAYEVDNDALQARIGTNKVYGRYLEKGTGKMEAREFLERTRQEREAVTNQILIGKKFT